MQDSSKAARVSFRRPLLALSAWLAAALFFSNAAPASAVLSSVDEGRKAQIVLRGVVEGQRYVVDRAKQRVYTVTKVRVRKALKGSAPQVIEVQSPGGRVGKYRLVVSDQPGFAKGEGVQLYLSKQAAGGYRVVNGVEGKRHISGPEGTSLPSLGTGSVTGHYKWDGEKWDSADLPMPYWINNQFTSQEVTVVRDSFDTWQNDPDSLMTYQYEGLTSRSSTNDPMGGPDGLSPDGFNDMTKGDTGGSIATTYYWIDGTRMVDVDIVFDYSAWSWSSDGTPAAYEFDLQNIATHEIGHTLVLSDLYPSGAPYYGNYTAGDEIQTMWGFAGQGETNKRTLEAGDRAGIAAVYPNPYPRNVTGFSASTGDGKVTLSWTNPTQQPFDGVLLMKKEGSVPTSTTDGTQIYNGTGTSWTDSDVTNGTTYYYRIYSSGAGLYSSGVVASAMPRMASALAASVNSSTIRWGRSTVFHSSLAPTITPAPSVILQSSPNGSTWRTAGIMPWDGERYSATVAPKALTYYRSMWQGDGTYLDTVSSPMRIRVRPKFATGLSRRGLTIRVSGYVYPPHDGSKVGFYFQRYSGGGTWKTYAWRWAYLAYNSPIRSKASSSYGGLLKGRWRVRFRFGDSDHLATDAYSALFTVR